MSDPTARRGDNIMAMLKAMKKDKNGWTKRQILDFLFVRYRAGVTEQTLESIFNQLKDRGIIFAKPVRKGTNIYRWFVNEERLMQLTGVNLE